MFSLITGTVLLAFVHALIPNHWLPLVAVAKAERWKQADVTTITFLAALAHVTGTVVLGLVLGLIGKELQEEYRRIIELVSSVLLIVFGLIMMLLEFHSMCLDPPRQTLSTSIR